MHAFVVLSYHKTSRILRALLRKLRISGLRGMMTWTTKYLCLADVDITIAWAWILIVCDSGLPSWTACILREIGSGVLLYKSIR